MAQSGRLLSLDVMRGITIAGMIMVNNPGTWEYVYGRIRTEYLLTYLLQRILPFRKSTHPGSDATPCTGLWYRFTDRACYQS